MIELTELYADGLISRYRLRKQRRFVYRWAQCSLRGVGWLHNWTGTWAAWNAAAEAIVPPCHNFIELDPNYGDIASDIFGNPFRPVAFDATWRSDTALSLAKHIYDSRDFSAMPILADALQDAGCEHADVLAHCRDESLTHVRGCWVIDLVLGKV